MGHTTKPADDLLAHALELCRLAEAADALPFRLEVRRGRLEIRVQVWESDAPAGSPGPSPPDRALPGQSRPC